MKYILGLFLFLTNFAFASQDRVADSIRDLLNQPVHDTDKMLFSLNLGEHYYRTNTDSAEHYWKQAIDIASKYVDKENQVGKTAKLYAARGYNNSGAIAIRKGNHVKGIQLFIKSLKIKEALDDKKGIGKTANNIGYLLGKQGDLEAATKYLNRSLEVRSEIGDSSGVSQSLHNLGYINYQNQLYEKALKYFRRSLALRLALGLEYEAGNCYNNIGLVYFDKNQLDSARFYYEKTIAIFEKYEDEYNLSMVYANLAQINISSKEKDKGLLYAHKAHLLAEKLNYPEALKTTSEILYEHHKHSNNHEEALKFHEIFVKMKDSLRNVNTEKAALKAQFSYEHEKDSIEFEKQHLIDQLELKKQESENKEYRTKLYGIAIGAILLLILLFVVFKSLKQKQKDNKLISEQKRIVEESKKIIEEKNIEISQSIDYAELIQTAVLPKLKISELFENSFLLFKPRDVVSGDFYWFEQTERFKLLTVADCTGHGIPGAFISMIGTILLNEIYNSKEIVYPNEILKELDRLVRLTLGQDEETAKLRDGMDIAFCLFDTENNELFFSGANNPLWVISDLENENLNAYKSLEQDNNALYEIKGDKMAIGGKSSNEKNFSLNKVQLKQGDSFYIFSDGFADQFGGPKGKKFMSKNFKKLCLQANHKPMQEQEEFFNTTITNWMKTGNTEQVDDMCIIGVSV